MIIGVVNTHTEATIRLPVRAADGRELEMEGVLDTGFNGSLTLSPAVIGSLGLRWRTRSLVMLANGSEDHCDIYAATVIWGQATEYSGRSRRHRPIGMPCCMVTSYTCRWLRVAVSSSNHCSADLDGANDASLPHPM